MNLATARSRIKARLNYTDTDLDGEIDSVIRELITQELELEPELPWFLLSEEAEANTAIGDDRLAVPTDFLREYEYGALWLKESDGTLTALPKYEMDVLVRELRGSGKPRAYALTGKYFRLFPTPDQQYTVRMVYYKRSAALNADTDTNEWLTEVPWLVVAGAARVVAEQYLRDGPLADRLQAEYQRARMRLMVADEARRNANLRMEMGD